MSFISPPTDNLYKFMALFGLAIVISGAIFAYQNLTPGPSGRTAFVRELELFRVDRKYVMGEIEYLKSKKKLSIAERETLRIKKWKWQRREATMTLKLEQYRRIVKNNNIALFLIAVYVSIGATISRRGFILWYQRIQKHIDATAEREANISTP